MVLRLRTFHAVVLLSLSWLFVGPSQQSSAVNIYWDGEVDDSWEVIPNWHFTGFFQPLPRLPVDSDDVFLTPPSPDEVRLYSDTPPVNSLFVGEGVHLFTNSHGLQVDDSGSGTMTISGSQARVEVAARIAGGWALRTDHLVLEDFGRLSSVGGVRIVGETTLTNRGNLTASSNGESQGSIEFGDDITVSDHSNFDMFDSNIVFAENLKLSVQDSSQAFFGNSSLLMDNGLEFEMLGDSRLVLSLLTTVRPGTKIYADHSQVLTEGDIRIEGGSFVLDSQSSLTMVDTAEFHVTAGGDARFVDPLEIDGTYFYLTDGRLLAESISRVSGGDFYFEGGTLTVGSYGGDLTNEGGILAPGPITDSGGAGGTSILGDYVQSADAAIQTEIGGLVTATEYDFIQVTGTANLDGVFQVALIDDFLPQPTDQFVVFSANTLVGFLDNIGNGGRLTTIGGEGSFQVHYGPASPFNPNQVVLRNFLPATADFDQDGDVDGSDFLEWQRDPSVGDLADWQANYGNSAPLAAANTVVPEPMTLILAIAALSCGIGRRLPQ